MQDGKIELSENDITTNLPYDPRVSLAFDHRESEIDRLRSIVNKASNVDIGEFCLMYHISIIAHRQAGAMGLIAIL